MRLAFLTKHTAVPVTRPEDRRTERRVETLQSAVLYVVSDNSSMAISIRDFSRRGLGLVVHKRIPVGETVIIESQHGFLVGLVRHLRPLHDGWIVGVQLEAMPAHTAVLDEMANSESRARIRQLFR